MNAVVIQDNCSVSGQAKAIYKVVGFLCSNWSGNIWIHKKKPAENWICISSEMIKNTIQDKNRYIKMKYF